MGAHVGDIGTQIIFDTGESLAEATVHELVYFSPNGNTGTWDATVEGNTLKFTTAHATDIDCAGTWSVQAHVATPGWEAHSEVGRFTVQANLNGI